MKLLVKEAPSVCVNKTDFSQNFWPFEVMVQVVELFAGDRYVDFDDRHFDNLPNWGTQFDLVQDLYAADIISKYEDEMYFSGPNFNALKDWLNCYTWVNPKEVKIS